MHENDTAQPAAADPAIEFKFESQTVRTVIKDGEPWFIASDVCTVLEQLNPTDAMARLDDDEKGTTELLTTRGMKAVNIINESGLYSLILTSRKPQARSFKRWVTHEVLPSVARTGRYSARPETRGQRLDDAEAERWIPLPGRPGVYSVTVAPDGRYYSFRSNYGMLIEDDNLTTARLLCHQLKVIESFWRKIHLLQSSQQAAAGGFAAEHLEKAIQHGDELATHFLRVCKPTPVN